MFAVQSPGRGGDTLSGISLVVLSHLSVFSLILTPVFTRLLLIYSSVAFNPLIILIVFHVTQVVKSRYKIPDSFPSAARYLRCNGFQVSLQRRQPGSEPQAAASFLYCFDR